MISSSSSSSFTIIMDCVLTGSNRTRVIIVVISTSCTYACIIISISLL